MKLGVSLTLCGEPNFELTTIFTQESHFKFVRLRSYHCQSCVQPVILHLDHLIKGQSLGCAIRTIPSSRASLIDIFVDNTSVEVAVRVNMKCKPFELEQ